MPLKMLRRLGRKVATRVADRVAKNELFEQHGERARQSPLDPSPEVADPPRADPQESAEPPPPAAGLEGCVPMDAAAIKALLGPADRTRVVNHWATWCDPCIDELPHLVSLHRQLGDAIEMLGVSWDLFEGGSERGTVEKIEAFSAEHGLTWGSALVTAAPSAFFDALDIDWQRIPQTWIIAPDGTITRRIEGVIDADAVAVLVNELSA